MAFALCEFPRQYMLSGAFHSTSVLSFGKPRTEQLETGTHRDWEENNGPYICTQRL